MYTSSQIKSISLNVQDLGAESAIPVKVQFRHMTESKRVIWLINQMMEKFAKYPLSGAKANVVIDETHHREGKGIFQVKATLSVPGERLYVARSEERTGMHDGVYDAVADVFDSIERQLVKHHGKRSHRRVEKAYECAA